MKSRVKRMLFSAEEDSLIFHTVGRLGIDRASIFLEKLLKRPRRIIREHYKNVLGSVTDPNFEENEDMQLLKLVKDYGTQWEIIARIIVSKSPSQIKSRYNVLQYKIKKGEVLLNGERTPKYKSRKCKCRHRSPAVDTYIKISEHCNACDVDDFATQLRKMWDKINEDDIFEVNEK